MKLYKNVDIIDLESILSKGILSLNESGNDNWDEGRRADNSRDVVYLFRPLSKQNSFCNYGVALLEIEIPDDQVREYATGTRDVNKGKYVEYITEKVLPDLITHIYIPEIFKERVEIAEVLSDDVMSKIVWCGFKATYWSANGFAECPEHLMTQFAKTAPFIESTFNFFRGEEENRDIIDLYDYQYIY